VEKCFELDAMGSHAVLTDVRRGCMQSTLYVFFGVWFDATLTLIIFWFLICVSQDETLHKH
jgi:hypothetical protein